MLPAPWFCLIALAAPPVEVIEGVALVAGTDRPAARVPLRIFDNDTGAEAVADAEGRFRVETPPGKTIGPARDGQQGPTCRAMAHDPGSWSTEVLEADPVHPRGQARSQGLESSLKPARTRWEVRGARVRLIAECPAMGEVEVTVRGPDGSPAADRGVFLFDVDATGFHGGASVRYSGKTDAAGMFRLRRFEGTRQLRVLVPGVGFGVTGSFEVVGGRVARPNLPPLARFARVEGRLDPTLNRPGTRVHLGSATWPEVAWDRSEAEADDQGRFAMADVVPGPRRIAVTRAGSRVATEPASVDLDPGQVLSAVAPLPPAPPKPGEAFARPGPAPARDAAKEVVWAEGTVRDDGGRPLPGAAVHLHTSHHGGIRMVEDIRSTTADAQGHYKITGPFHEFMEAPTVIVKAEGRPPAVAYAPTPGAEGQAPPLDIAVAARGAAAVVTVFKGNKPLAGAGVRVESRGGVGMSSPFYVGAARGPGRDAISSLFAPTAVTGHDGVARFDGLFPGDQEVAASDAPDLAKLVGIRWPRDRELTFGIAEESVAAGGRFEHAIAVHRQPTEVPFKVLRPDGSPVANQDVAFSFGREGARSSTWLKLDAQGVGTHAFDSPGLWAVDVKFRDSELRSIPIAEEPYYVAEAVIPASPGLALAGPVELTGVLRERGSIRARLLDAGRRPARGTVMIVRPFGEGRPITQAGTVDAEGLVRFADLPSGEYTLAGTIDGLTPPFLPTTRGPVPDAAAMLGQVMIPDAKLKLESGAEASVDLRPSGVAYVRGTIRPPAGRKAADYIINPGYDPHKYAPRRTPVDDAGQFACGPLLAGAHTFGIMGRAADGSWGEAGTKRVVVAAGEVARVDFEPVDAPPGPPGRGRRAMLGMGGVSVLGDDPTGAAITVFLPDGRTPAFAARALLFVPGQSRPVAQGLGDGAGRLTWRGRWMAGGPAAEAEPGRVDRPTAAISLPGLAGACFAEVGPGRPTRAVLPGPASVAGRVTLGGRPIAGRNARVRVVAAHRGRGVLDAALGVEASAQADGRFELRGLTPGRHVAQAARDSIWTSAAVELVVEEGKPTPALALDIPEPGEPVTVEVVDEKDRPYGNRVLTLARPQGPLDAPWPATIRTDPLGRATFRGLEAGSHTVLVADLPGRHSFRVDEAKGGDRPRHARVVIDRPGP